MLKDEPLLAPDRIGTDGAGPYCTACGFWDTGLKPTLPEHAVEAVAGDIRPG